MRKKIEQTFSDSNSGEHVKSVFKTKLINEYNYDLLNDKHPKLIYDQLSNERDLFVYAFRKDYSFSKSWHYGVLYEDSFNRLLVNAKNKFNPNEKEGLELYNSMLMNPNRIDKEKLLRGLTILCKINGSISLELTIKKFFTAPLDLSPLLSVAIGSLNVSIIQTLTDLGVDLHKPLLYLHDSDNGFNCFCSPLYYAIALPGNPQSIIARFGPIIKPDNPKLLNIIKYLINNGANPEQRCIVTPCDVFDLEQAPTQDEADRGDRDCKKLCQTLLDDSKGQDLSQDFYQTMKDIIEWTPLSNSFIP